jgi:hypothetical protein
MASEADSSSVFTTDSRTSKRGLSSPVWIHSRPAVLGSSEDLKLQYCVHCEADDTVSAERVYRTKNPTNFRGHLKHAHTIIVPVDLGPVLSIAVEHLEELYT